MDLFHSGSFFEMVFPSWLLHTYAVAIGLVVGSFLNVVIWRLPRDQSVIKPRSTCPQCKKAIQWYDNIPVFSYIALGGKCRACHKKIPIRYPLVEILTGFLFWFTAYQFGWSWLLFVRDWPFVAALIAVTFIDLDHRIIPDELSLGGLVLGLLTTWAVPEIGWLSSLMGAMVGFGIFFLFAWGYFKLSGRHGLGGGDVKLLAMLGAFLGPSGVMTTIFVSSVAGSIIGISWAIINGQKNVMKVAIPYGPFLVLGGLLAYYFGDILQWLPFMNPI